MFAVHCNNAQYMLSVVHISASTIYNFAYHDIQFHISRYITCHDIQCAHLSDNSISALKAIMRRNPGKNKKYSILGSNRWSPKKITKIFHTGLEPLTFAFKSTSYLTVCAICTNTYKLRISLDFILKWSNCPLLINYVFYVVSYHEFWYHDNIVAALVHML